MVSDRGSPSVRINTVISAGLQSGYFSTRRWRPLRTMSRMVLASMVFGIVVVFLFFVFIAVPLLCSNIGRARARLLGGYFSSASSWS